MAQDRTSLFGGNKNKSYGTTKSAAQDQKARNLQKELALLEAIEVLIKADNFKAAIYHSTVGESRLKQHGIQLYQVYNNLVQTLDEYKYNSKLSKAYERHIDKVKDDFTKYLTQAINEIKLDKNRLENPVSSTTSSKTL